MRYRTLDQRIPLYWKQVRVNPGCVTGTDTTENCYTKIGTKKEMWDLVTPGYSRRRAAGEIIVNPLFYREEKRTNSLEGPHVGSTACQAPPKTNTTHRYGPWYSWWRAGAPAPGEFSGLAPKELIPSGDIQNLVEAAATRAWSDVAKSDAQMLVFLAELRKTYALLRNPLANVQKYLNKIRYDRSVTKDPSKKALALGQYVSSEWLTYRYGWLQLMRDITSILKAVGRERKSGLVSARGRNALEKSDSVSSVALALPSYGFEYTIQYFDSVKVKAGLLHNAELDLDDYLGFTADQLIPTLWEVIPFSFVVDWFANVQSYLTALVPYAVVPIKGKYHVIERSKTAVLNVTRTYWHDNNPTGFNYFIQGVAGAEHVTIRTKERLDTLPAPSLRSTFKLSDFTDTRIKDALALIIQQLNRR